MGPRKLASFLLFLSACTGLEAQQRSVTMTGHVHPAARAANDFGAVEPSFPLNGVTILLKRTAAQQSDLDQLLSQQRDPTWPNFRQWLTPEEYGARLGATSSQMDQITAWLAAQGFTGIQVARSRTFVTFNGTAAQASTAMRTQIHRYVVNGETHYANATDPSLPASIASISPASWGLTTSVCSLA